MRHVTIYNPSSHAGGSNLLLARFACYLASQPSIALELIDFPDGLTYRMLSKQGLQFEFRPYALGRSYPITADSTLVAILLHTKLLGTTLLPEPSTRLLFWSTHPYDGYKILPTFNLLYRADYGTKKRLSSLLHPRYRLRIREFLEEGTRLGGLWAMDQSNAEANAVIFGTRFEPPVVPIFTESAPRRVTLKVRTPRQAVWIGRLADFKTQPILAFGRALSDFNSRASAQIDLVLVGDGEDKQPVVAQLSTYPNLKVRALGHVQGSELTSLLSEEADLVVGHGLALLEAARMGLPSLIVDAFYLRLKPGELKVRWLDGETGGHVGHLVHTLSELEGHPPERLLEEFLRGEEVTHLGERSYQHWAKHHEVESVCRRAYELLGQTRFTMQRCRETGLFERDLLSQALDRSKLEIQRWKGRRR
jgi:hypothetical protein